MATAVRIRVLGLCAAFAGLAVVQCAPPPVELTQVPTGAIQSAVTSSNDVKQVIQWIIRSGTGPFQVTLSANFEGDANYKVIAKLEQADAVANSFDWFPPNRPTPVSATVSIKIDVVDAASTHTTHTLGAFTIVRNAALAAGSTTLRDFDQPGTQPLAHGRDFTAPSDCSTCHADTSKVAAPGRPADKGVNIFWDWIGTMMAQASLDPLFEACLEIANQDAPESGDLCIRCHTPMAWLNGRSTPTDHSLADPPINHAVALANQELMTSDKIGVFCEHCHRLVDAKLAANPAGNLDGRILANLGANQPAEYGNGMYVIDPDRAVIPETAAELGQNEPDGVLDPGNARRRGPFAAYPTTGWVLSKAVQGNHRMITSAFHQKAELCATCHDVSNPALERAAVGGAYTANAVDASAGDFSVSKLMPIERTFSEWKASVYAGAGVSAPVFDTAKNVRTCQDCHMRDAAGASACSLDARPENQMPFHDLTGGNTFIPAVLRDVYYQGSGTVAGSDRADIRGSLTDTIERAQYMLRNAASIEAKTVNVAGTDKLRVRVYNETGHKLPTGYPEGRRMWVNVKFLDANDKLLKETNRYDLATGVLSVQKNGQTDPESRVYEAHLGTGGHETFHFVLNNEVIKDNRIPPRGFDNAAFDQFGGTPVHATYANGQFWDDSDYAIPGCARKAQVTLYYQTASREYIEFLRDENHLTEQGKGAGLRMYDLWKNNGRSTPEPVGREVGLCFDLDHFDACSAITATPEPGVIGCTDPAPCVCGSQSCTGTGSATVEVTFPAAGANAAPRACSAVSRKSHAGTDYDVIVSNGESEPRLGGPTRVLVRFDQPLDGTVVGTVNTTGALTSSSFTTGVAGPDLVDVTLNGVANGQCLVLSLSGFKATNGQMAPDVTLPIIVRLGDVSGIGDGRVGASSDLADAQDLSGLAIDPQIFRNDVNLSGGVTAADIARISSEIAANQVTCP
jgi:hypothetical protein